MTDEEELAVEYRDIPGFSGYRAGSDGSVWSRRISGKGSHSLRLEWERLSPSFNKSQGRYTLHPVRDDGEQKTVTVASLVALAFHGPKQYRADVRHLDGCRTNDVPSNLAYGTRAENEADKIQHGTTNRGERCGGSKVKEDDVRSIRNLYSQGITQKRIAEMFGIDQSSVSNIIRRKRWGWLDVQ